MNPLKTILVTIFFLSMSTYSHAEEANNELIVQTGLMCSVELDDPDNMKELNEELSKAGCQRGDIIAFIRDRTDEWSLRMAARLCSFDHAVDTNGRWERCVYIGSPRKERNPKEQN